MREHPPKIKSYFWALSESRGGGLFHYFWHVFFVIFVTIPISTIMIIILTIIVIVIVKHCF